MIDKSESKIIGSFSISKFGISYDDNSKRIFDLIESYLEKVSTDSSGWNVLYQDLSDGRYWELIYIQSDQHGAGAPSLVNISHKEAQEKYLIK